MSQSPEKPGTAAGPLKLALAVVLAVIFVVVLIVQFGGTSSAEQTGRQRDSGEDQASALNPQSATGGLEQSKEATTTHHAAPGWPTLDRADVLRYDPFATPAAFTGHQNSTDISPESESQEKAAGLLEEALRKKAEQEQALARLRQEGVAVVIGGSGNDHIAVVGSQTIHVGDLLDGFRVIAIEPDGVVLEQPEIE